MVEEHDCPVLSALGAEPRSLVELQRRTGLDTAALLLALLELELQGQVRRLPGGIFQRIAMA